MWTAIWTGIGETSTQFFKLLPGIGIYIDLLFVFLGATGSLYWVYYEYYVKKGGKNYLAKTK